MTADHAGQTGSDREVCSCVLVLPDSRNYVGPHHANGCLLFPGQIQACISSSRPVPVAGQEGYVHRRSRGTCPYCGETEAHEHAEDGPVAGQAAREPGRDSVVDAWRRLHDGQTVDVSELAPDTRAQDEAREAAVEAVAQRLSADYDSQRAWVKGDEEYREAWRDDARELVDLVVAALSAAGEQETRHALLGQTCKCGAEAPLGSSIRRWFDQHLISAGGQET